MAYNLEISEKLDKVFYKLVKKDKLSMEIINKKILAILDNPYQFKPLRNEFAGVRRVHIEKVLFSLMKF
jgi:mRNA-degrading endonuclease RelE of RelBE toxin-antitoxin system